MGVGTPLPGWFANYAVRSGLYASYRDDTTIFMLGAHLAHGEQIYFEDQGSGEWSMDFSVYGGRETRLAIPIGMGPLARHRSGLLWSAGIIFAAVLDQGSAYPHDPVYSDPPQPPTRYTIDAPVEFTLTMQLDWGRPTQDRNPPRTR